MAQQMMWDPILSNYRGQSTNGTVVTVEPPAMDLANKKAGKTVYDSDWWVETVYDALEHWGIYAKRWVDASTKMPRFNFSLDKSKNASASTPKQADSDAPANPPTKPLNSGPLTNRIMSGPLGTNDRSKNKE